MITTDQVKDITTRIDNLQVHLNIEQKQDQPRIPFGWLLERGLLDCISVDKNEVVIPFSRPFSSKLKNSRQL